ncbi:MAG: hypothetical protein EOP56_02325 [Sphingobacteriales bacterium]|nr:MAG: hypothetical protein EOP56_02325 [Sphingobacteriales bacterium]
MKHIKLLENPEEIKQEPFLGMYLTKVYPLIKTLGFLDRVGIEANVIYHGEIMGDSLKTQVEVHCADADFKKVIEEATQKFNAISIRAVVL